MSEVENDRRRGFSADSRALADFSVIPGLLADEPSFARGVPYLLIDAIRQVAQDAEIIAAVALLLGTGEWVMWGPNMRRATPNEAVVWHVDLESFLWPTVAVELAGCTAGTQGRREMPRVGTPEQNAGFADGRFFLFDGSVWHRGDRKTSRDRVVLFLHCQRADQPRVPLVEGRGLPRDMARLPRRHRIERWMSRWSG